MNLNFSGRHLSLTDFEVAFDEKVSIITGLNGSGKTQLLSLLNSYYSDTLKNPAKVNQPPYSNLQIEGINISHIREIVYQGANMNIGNTIFNTPFKYSDFKEVVLYLLNVAQPSKANEIRRYLGKNGQNQRGTPSNSDIITNGNLRIHCEANNQFYLDEICDKSGVSKEELKPSTIQAFFPFDKFLLNHQNFEQILPFLFYLYQLRENLDNSLKLSEPPWVLLQEIIDELGFAYEVIAPDTQKISEILDNEMDLVTENPYRIILFDKSTNQNINFSNLSSGEKILFSLGFLKYSYSVSEQNTKLIILDEPEAHLHPSMKKHFFQIIHDFLAVKKGIKILMSTHSATTLALASKYNDVGVYYMSKPTLLKKDNSINFSNSINYLSNGLVFVTPETKFVFVEDNDDVEFYRTILSVSEIAKESNINFMPTSNGEVNGGKDRVKEWVNRFSSFNSVIKGIIDKDRGNLEYNEENKLLILNRYSIENYLFDPVIMYCFILNSKDSQLSNINHLDLDAGLEHKISNCDTETLQKAVDSILSIMNSVVSVDDAIEGFHYDNSSKNLKITSELNEIIEVKYLNGHNLKIPKWIVEARGKDLRNLYKSKFNLGGFSHLNALKYIRATNHIPKELPCAMEDYLK
ncbi:AAA family ATPase [Carboxylicivirga sp. RSCT41]|uniref:AAA family ATPase n=1 Tax=Carboxylicivirga agarovorans TaxID=3417570 RepID=UPI003D34FAE9